MNMRLRVRAQAWLILGAFFGLSLFLRPYAWLRDVPTPPGELRPRPDFIAFYSAAILIQEDPGHLYEPEKQSQIEARITGEPAATDGPAFLPFGYPAVTALLFLPFSLLSYSEAFIALLFVNILVSGVTLDLLVRKLGLSEDAGSLLVLGFAASISSYQALSSGQVSLLIFLIYVMLVTDILRKNPRSGVWAGLLVIKPTLVPVVGLWFVMRREWKNLAYAAAVGGALIFISVAVIGLDGLRDFLVMGSNIGKGKYLSVHTLQMPNLRALSQFMGFGDVLWVVLGLVILTLLYFKSRETSDASCAALLLAIVLVTPHIHYHDLYLIWIVVALAIRRIPRTTVLLRWGLLGTTLLATAVIYTVMAKNVYLPIMPLALLAVFIGFVLKDGTLEDLPVS
jgi:hypothetical protein